ncbi:MAG: hypothetical protein IAF00_06335 [Phycisphaerales bacterium]|nr:hypothetical protein [Phycisphaerales bacterium]
MVPGHGAVPFESTLERDTVTWLVQRLGFHRIVAQPITLHYGHPDGYLARYTPDYRVVYTQLPDELHALGFGHDTYIEVKYADEAAKQTSHLARLGEVVWRQTGYPWVVLTEREVRASGRLRLSWSHRT